jgi:hypothetical protein
MIRMRRCMARFGAGTTTLLLLGLLASCSTGATDAPASAAVDAGDAGAKETGAVDAGATNPINALPSGWNEIRPGGRTACSDGSPFSFFVRPGRVDRVLFEFSGGGGCWSASTCGFASSLFSKNVDPAKLPWADGSSPGVYDKSNADNPFRDWHHVYVPYCTGDVHWGDNVATYSDAVTIAHVGAVNARAALDWLYANVPKPQNLMLTGCSAGGYASIFWTPHVRQHYGAGTPITQFSDGAAGVIGNDFFASIQASWRYDKALASFVPGLQDTGKIDALSSLYQSVGNFYPDVPLAQFNTSFDEIQSFFFTTLGGGNNVAQWSTMMRAEVALVASTVPSFRSITAAGKQHCIINQPEFYTASFDGVKLTDWLKKRIANEPVSSHDCGN